MEREVMKDSKGFSLIELMIVVAIIGVLAAIAVPNFQKYQAKSRQSEAKSLLTAIYTSNKAWFSEWALYTGDFGAMGMLPEGDLRYNVGFSGQGPALPGNYTGRALLGVFDSANYCDNVVCTDLSAGDTSNFTAPTATTFVAAANGDIDGDSTLDQWTIDQNKQLRIVGTNNDLND